MAASRWTRKAFSSLNHSAPASVVVAHGTRSGAYDLLDAHAEDEESYAEAHLSSPQPPWIREQGFEETSLVGQMGVYVEGMCGVDIGLNPLGLTILPGAPVRV